MSQTALDSTANPPWHLATRIAFRFVFCWFILTIGADLIYQALGFQWLGGLVDAVLAHPVEWFNRIAAKLVGYTGPLEAEMSGSSDRTVDWLGKLGTVIFAATLAVIWSAIDRKPRRYDRLYAFVRIYARYWLGLVMIGYGLEKIFLQQMPPLTIDRLDERIGDASPMRILWVFIASSPVYERFTGLAEFVGGALLLWSRTALLGSLLVVAVMGNVVMFNLCYDVPVKLYSSTLLITAIFLCAKEAPRLFALLSGKAVPASPPWVAPSPRWQKAVIVLEILGSAFMAFSVCWSFHERLVSRPADLTTILPFEGKWRVEKQIVDGREIQGILSEDQRWAVVRLIRYPSGVDIEARLVDETTIEWWGELDEQAHTLHFTHKGQEMAPTLTYTLADAEHMTLADPQQKWSLTLRKLPPHEYLLQTRGFRWVSEEPFNR